MGRGLIRVTARARGEGEGLVLKQRAHPRVIYIYTHIYIYIYIFLPSEGHLKRVFSPRVDSASHDILDDAYLSEYEFTRASNTTAFKTASPSCIARVSLF